MAQKINFKAFKEASDVQKFLETQLPIGVATPTDVFSFLDARRLEHSELINHTEPIDPIGEKSFEQIIFSSAPAKRVGWIFKAGWYIQFHFNHQRLAEIEVHKDAIAL